MQLDPDIPHFGNSLFFQPAVGQRFADNAARADAP